jgi:nucleotide-binding universal stress UspA family protein
MNAPSLIWRPTKILLASDLSQASGRELQYAVAVARHFDACVYLTHILPGSEHSTVSQEGAAADQVCREDAEQKIAAILKSGQMNGVRCEILLERGFLWQTLDALLRKHGIDFVVVGTHGRKDMQEGFGGSWAELIFRHADCPVMTVGPEARNDYSPTETFRNILLATDFGRASQRSVPYACSLAREYGATLTLLHVLSNTGVNSQGGLAALHDTTRVQLLESLPPGTDQNCSYEFEVRTGDSAHEILDFARHRKIDLIVMGAKSGTTLLNHLPEPTTYTVASGAPCPVLTIRA